MLDFATAHRFAVGKLTVTLGTFGLNRFTLGPFLASTFIAAFTFSEFTHQLTPFDLDPSLASNQDLTFPIIVAFASLDPFPRNSFTDYRIVIPLDPHQVVVLLTPLPFLMNFV